MPDQWSRLLLAGDAFDPDLPVESALAEEALRGGTGATLLRKVMLLALVLALAALMAVAAHRLLPLLSVETGLLLEIIRDLRTKWVGLSFAGIVFILAGLTPLPITIPLVLVGSVYGIATGFIVSMVASTTSALIGFGIGWLIGPDRARRLSGRGMARVLRVMPRGGILVLTMLRLVPVAPFAVVNLVAGAAHMRLTEYVLGTVVGMLPVSAALTLFGDRAAAVLYDPSWFNIAILTALTAFLIAVEHSLARRLSHASAAAQDQEVRRE